MVGRADEGSWTAGLSGTRCRIDVDGAGRYGWRLIAPNGRVVAVSASTFGDHGSCAAAFVSLCAGHAEMTGGVQHTPDGNGWVWLLRDADGRAAAVSGRAYERHSTCRAAQQRFRSLLAEPAVGGHG